jgi:hypothetical protein
MKPKFIFIEYLNRDNNFTVDKIYFDVDRQKLLEVAMKKIDIDKMQNRKYREHLREIEIKFNSRRHINLHLDSKPISR